MDDVLLTGGQALNGLLAGIYLAFVVAVMPALHGLPDDTFVRVMNRINVVIVNPAFLTLFLGAPVLAVILAAVRRDPLTIAAAVAAVSRGRHDHRRQRATQRRPRRRRDPRRVRDAVGAVALPPTGAAAVAFGLLCIPTSK